MGTKTLKWTLPALLAASIGGWYIANTSKARTQTVVRVGVDHSPPFYSVAPGGGVSGLAIDVLNEAARRANIRIEWVVSQDVPVDDALAARHVQMWPLVGATEERRKRFYLTDPWLESDYVLVSLESSRIRNRDEAAGKVVAQARLRMTTALAAKFLSRSRMLVKLRRSDAVSAVCAGEAQGALVEGRALDSLLLTRPPGCENAHFNISALAGATTPLGIIAVPELRNEARALRSEITDLIASGYMGSKLDEWSPFSAEGARSVWAQQEANGRNRLYRALAVVGFLLAAALAWLAWRGFRLKRAAEDAQASLREAQRRFTAFMDTSPALSFMKDAGGRLLYVNQAWCRVFGQVPENVLGKDDYALFPEDVARELRTFDLSLLAEGRPQQIVEQIPVSATEMREMLVVKFPFSNEAGSRFIGGTAIDITERQSAVRDLAASESRYRELFEKNPLPAWVCDRQTLAFMNVNAAATRSYGWSFEEFVNGMGLPDILTPSELRIDKADLEKLDAAHARSGQWSHQTRDGRRLKVEVTSYEMEYEHRSARLMIVRDITDQERTLEQLRVSEERWQLALHAAGDALWDWDLSSGRVFRSPRWATMLGYAEHEIGDSREDFLALLHPEDVGSVEHALRDYFEKKTSVFAIEYRLRHKNGSWRWIMDRGKAIWDERDEPLRMAGSHTDITERKRAEEQLEIQAHTDPLTSLSNRREFDRLLAMEFQLSRHSGRPLTLFICDLDQFKQVNDTWGHAVGDRVLVAFAESLKHQLRPTDLVARIGGDEFVVALPETTSNRGKTIADHIRDTFAKQEFRVGSGVFHVTSSFGVAELSRSHAGEKDLLAEADRRLYDAKQSGRNCTLALA